MSNIHATIVQLRLVLDKISSKYGPWAHIEIHEDGSGVIIDGGNSYVVKNHDELADFDNLGELMEILEIGD